MAKSALDEKIAQIDAELARLQGIRDYLTSETFAENAAEKPKRGRGKNKPKPGLPTEGNPGF